MSRFRNICIRKLGATSERSVCSPEAKRENAYDLESKQYLSTCTRKLKKRLSWDDVVGQGEANDAHKDA
jgi:hypothetical protein